MLRGVINTPLMEGIIIVIAVSYLLIIFISWEPISAPHKQEVVYFGA